MMNLFIIGSLQRITTHGPVKVLHLSRCIPLFPTVMVVGVFPAIKVLPATTTTTVIFPKDSVVNQGRGPVMCQGRGARYQVHEQLSLRLHTNHT